MYPLYFNEGFGLLGFDLLLMVCYIVLELDQVRSYCFTVLGVQTLFRVRLVPVRPAVLV
jgi:hypothetical protein